MRKIFFFLFIFLFITLTGCDSKQPEETQTPIPSTETPTPINYPIGTLQGVVVAGNKVAPPSFINYSQALSCELIPLGEANLDVQLDYSELNIQFPGIVPFVLKNESTGQYVIAFRYGDGLITAKSYIGDDSLATIYPSYWRVDPNNRSVLHIEIESVTYASQWIKNWDEVKGEWNGNSVWFVRSPIDFYSGMLYDEFFNQRDQKWEVVEGYELLKYSGVTSISILHGIDNMTGINENGEEILVTYENVWLSPDLAAYVKKYNAQLENIDEINYFTAPLILKQDGKTYNVKVKLLEETHNGEFIPSYETMRELLAENMANMFIDYSNLAVNKDSLFVVRAGEFLQEDLDRADTVVKEFMARVNEESGENSWVELGTSGPSWIMGSGKIAEDHVSFWPDMENTVYMYFVNKFIDMPSNDFMTNDKLYDENLQIAQENISLFGMDPRRPTVLFFVDILGTDQHIGIMPTKPRYSDMIQVINLGFDESFYNVTLSKFKTSLGSYSNIVKELFNTSDLENFDLVSFAYNEEMLVDLSEEVKKEFISGPGQYYEQGLIEPKWSSRLNGEIIWVIDISPQTFCTYHYKEKEYCRNILTDLYGWR